MPLVSIVMATRNSGRYLGEALASVRGSLGAVDVDYEVVIADAGSRDDTLAIAAAAARTRVVSRSDTGIYDGMNRAIAAATGRYVLILNSDDMLLPGALSGALTELERRPECGLVSGSVVSGSTLEDAAVAHHAGAMTIVGLLFGIPAINARLFRSCLLRQTGPFRTDIGLGADRELLVRVAAQGARGHHLDAPLYFYRSHAGSHTIAGDRAGRCRVYASDAQLAAHFLRTCESDSDLWWMARAEHALATFKLKVVCRGRGPAPALAPATVRPGAGDLLRGLRLAAAWRGRLSGA